MLLYYLSMLGCYVSDRIFILKLISSPLLEIDFCYVFKNVIDLLGATFHFYHSMLEKVFKGSE